MEHVIVNTLTYEIVTMRNNYAGYVGASAALTKNQTKWMQFSTQRKIGEI